ncbi:hypothetical protein [Actinocorallia populi]|nr:hypothetical protein [Actinocorallia populi]
MSEFLSSLLSKALMTLVQAIVNELAVMIVRSTYARHGRTAPAMAF